MKVRVSYVVDVGEAMRRGIRLQTGVGKPGLALGLASRQEVKEWYESMGAHCDDDTSSEGEDALMMESEGIPEDQWGKVLEERRAACRWRGPYEKPNPLHRERRAKSVLGLRLNRSATKEDI